MQVRWGDMQEGNKTCAQKVGGAMSFFTYLTAVDSMKHDMMYWNLMRCKVI